HQAPRQLSLQSLADGDVPGVRPAEAQRDPEALGGADGHIGPEGPRGGQHGQRQQVGGHDGHRLGLLDRGEDGARIPDPTGGPGEASMVSASGSAATMATALVSLLAVRTGLGSQTRPEAPGYCTRAPKKSSSGIPPVPSAAKSTSRSSMPRPSARPFSTALG